MKTSKPVFFDQSKKRWPKVRAGIYFFGLSLTVVFLILIISIVVNPVLDGLSLPHSSFLPNGGHVIPNIAETLAKKDHLADIKKKLKTEIKQQANVKTSLQSNHNPTSTVRMGYFVNWDDSSLNSLKVNLSSLDIVAGEWLHLMDGSGTLREDNPERQKMVTEYIRTHKSSTKILALVNNFVSGQWQSEHLASSITTEENRKKMTDSLLAYVQEQKLDGVSLDLENIPVESQKDMIVFVQTLSDAFHAKKLLVTINLPAGDNNFDYKKYALYPDYVIIMAYDEHWSTSEAGPIASMDWFQNMLDKQLENIPSDKIILALGNYAYDWEDGSKEAQVRTFEEGILTAKESEGEITMDSDSLNPTFDYEDDNNKVHHVWMLDSTTVFNQMLVAEPYKTHGFALWRLGSEDPSVWTIFDKTNLTKANASGLSSMAFKYDVDYEGQGEILRVSDAPEVGQRTIGFDDTTGLIDELNYTKYPSPYVVSRYGSLDKKVALTFDDGPDPLYTPKVLDILKKYNIPATFFVIGENAEKYPEIVKRAFDEGSDIGNHTFTHPNIEDVSHLQLSLELSSTERLIEEITKHKSHLFRPPYSEDSEPDTSDQVRPIERINNLGYITVGMQIDPNDWQKPGVQKIVDATVEQAEKKKGNIILLHDAGGDRTETIQALPLIIEALKNKGYTFVSVSELLGKTRDEVMPPITKNEVFFRFFNNIGFNVIYVFNLLLHFLFVFWILLGFSRLLFIIILAIYQKYKQKEHFPKHLDNLSVAVIVPAYNEEKVINQTIASLLSCKHPKRFEIIVVDDGSKDSTYETVKEAYGDDERIQVYKIENSGKPGALNFGISKTDADILVALDADTVFSKDAIVNLVRHFEDEKVGAVAGNAKVGNRMNLMTRWQALEYIVSQNLDRRAFVVLNCITVVPGAVGAWRASLVKQAGGFSADTLAEDADLTIAIGKLGYKILYEENAIALTEAPDTVKAFTRQRYRWMFGTFQVGWKHKNILFRPKYGWLGSFALPNIFIYQILFPLVSPVMDLMMVISVVSATLDKIAHPASFSADSLYVILFYYAIFLLIDYVAAYIAFVLEGKEDRSLLIWLFLQRFFYRQLMYFVAIKSILSSLKWHEVGWNKLERKATVKMEE